MIMDRRLAEHLTYLRLHTTPRQWGLITEGLRHGNDPYDLSIPPPLPGDPHPAFSDGPHYREGQMLATLRDIYPDQEYQIVDGEGAPSLHAVPRINDNVPVAMGFGITVRLFVHTVHHWERPTGDDPSLYEQVIYLHRPQVREEPPLGGLPLGFEAHRLVDWQGPWKPPIVLHRPRPGDPENQIIIAKVSAQEYDVDYLIRLTRASAILGTLFTLFGLASLVALMTGISLLCFSLGCLLFAIYLSYPRR